LPEVQPAARMRPPMRFAVVMLAALTAAFGCGKEIGDGCVIGSDCSPNGDRQCLSEEHEGYCTIRGCDATSCPEESVCVRFFNGSFENKDCTVAEDCSLDELCTLAHKCAPRSAEVRYCMRTCESHDDCRDGYECRDVALMREHGGEPVLQPKPDGTPAPIDAGAPKFCASAP
jgi:hypothetical protein